VYDAQEVGDLYGYSQIALQDDVQDDAQLAVQWLCNSVVRVSDGVTIFPALDLSTREAEIIYTLDSSLYTVNSTAKTVEILNADVENSIVEANGVDYRRGPLTGNVSADYPIVIARSTDISEPIISYLPGSRLSHTTLNASNDQLIFALQELQLDLLDVQTETGVVDISNAALGEIGDVTLTGLAGNTEYLAFVPGSGWINQTAAELDIASAATVDALDGTNLELIKGGGTFIDAAIVALENDITNLDSDKVNYTDSIGTLGDVDVTGIASGDFFRYDGANWVPATPYFDDIQVSSGDSTTLTTTLGGIAVDIVSLDGEKVSYTDSIGVLDDVDTTTSSPNIRDVLEWDGSNWVPAAPPILTDKFWVASNPLTGLTTSEITGNGNRNLFHRPDLSSNYSIIGSQEGINSLKKNTADIDSYVLIPRDMTIRVSAHLYADATNIKSYGGGYLIPYKNIVPVGGSIEDDATNVNQYGVGNALYNFIYNQSAGATSAYYDLVPTYKEWIIPVNQNDKLYLLFWKWGGDSTSYANVQARYTTWAIEEYDSPSNTFTGVVSS
jgi:hypothetical protein